MELDIDGSLVSRPPMTEIEGHSTWTARIVVLCEAIFAGQHYLIGGNVNGAFYYLNGTWTLITNTFEPTYALQYADKVYFVPAPSSGSGGKWDPGGGFVAVAAIPKGMSGTMHKERFFIVPGNLSTVNPTRLSFSDVANFDSWPAPNFIDIGQGDGTKLIDTVVFQDNLLLFKDQTTYVLAYDVRPADSVVRKISQTIGVDDQHCVINYENQVYTLHNGWVYEIVNYDFNRLNTKVPFVRDETAPTPFAGEKRFLGQVGDRLIVRYFSRVYVYGFRTKTWSEWTSQRTPLRYFGPIITIHRDTGNEFYAGSSLAAQKGLIQLFDDSTSSTFERVLDPTPVELDTFSRVVAGGWGSADTGQVWTLDTGSAADISVDGNRGVMTHPLNTSNKTLSMGSNILNQDVVAVCSVSALPVTDSIFIYFHARRIDASNMYRGRLEVKPTGVVDLTISRLVAGVSTTIATTAAVYTVGATEEMTIRLRVQDSSIKVRTWKSASAEPNGWTATAVDATLTSTGNSGLRSSVGGAITGLPVNVLINSFTVADMATTLFDIQCSARTKNFDMAIANQFKRLWYWGADLITNRDIVATANPIVVTFAVTWDQLATVAWDALKTWDQPLTDVSGVVTTTPTGVGTSRRFAKFNKSLRYRQINFEIMLVTNGSTSDGPARLFTLIIITESKQGVVKGLS